MEAAAAEASERAEATAATAATGATAEIVAAAAPISKDGVFTAGYLWRCEEKASAGKNLERKMSWENPIKRFANCLLKVDKKKRGPRSHINSSGRRAWEDTLFSSVLYLIP